MSLKSSIWLQSTFTDCHQKYTSYFQSLCCFVTLTFDLCCEMFIDYSTSQTYYFY